MRVLLRNTIFVILLFGISSFARNETTAVFNAETPGNTALSSNTSGSEQAAKIRVIHTTDMGWDDENTLVRMLLFANDLQILGITTSGGPWQDQIDNEVPRILNKIDLYEQVYDNLKKHDPSYPTPDYLRSVTKWGNQKTNNYDEDTDGSMLIADALLDHSDNSPLWVTCWGGSATVTAALRYINDSHPSEKAYVANKLKIYFIAALAQGGEDNINYITSHYDPAPEMLNAKVYEYTNGWGEIKYWCDNVDYSTEAWTNAHYNQNHGALANSFQWANTWNDDVDGDAPSLLHLLGSSFGLRSDEKPFYGGWGSRFKRNKESNGTYINYTDDHYNGKNKLPESDEDLWLQKTCYSGARWADDFQNELAVRADWCIKDVNEANHPPVINLTVSENIRAKPGETINLSCSASDPDSNSLKYSWWQYKEAGTSTAEVDIQNSETSEASFVCPDDLGKTIHIILEVQDDYAEHPLTRYKRVIVDITNNTDDPADQLEPVTSQMVVTEDGTVIEGKHFRNILDKQALVIRADNVTVQGCLFEDCTWAVAIQGQREGISITGNRFENVGTAVSAIEGYIFHSKINYNEGVGIGIYNNLDAKNYPNQTHGYWSSNFVMLINANHVEVNYNIVDNKDIDTHFLEDLVNFYSEPHGGVAECSNVMVKGNKFRGTDNLCNISATGGGIVFDCVGEQDSIVDNYLIRISGYGAALTGVHNSIIQDCYAYYPVSHTRNYNSHPHFGIGGSDGGSFAFGNTDFNREADCNTIVNNKLIRCHAYSIDYGVNTSATDCGSNAGSGGVWNIYERCSENPFIKIDNDLRTTDPHWDSLLPTDMFANLPYQYFSGSFDDDTPPAAPQDLNVANSSAFTVDLNWDDNTDSDLRGYNVKRSETQGGHYTLIASKVAESEFHDKGLAPSTSYFYVVTAVDYSNNESEASNELPVTTSEAPALPDPNSFYDFDEGSGTNVADKGTAKNDGSLTGSDISWANGGIVSSPDDNQGCVEIKGSPYSGRAYVDIPFASFHNSDNYTYSAWVKYTNASYEWGYLFWQNGEYSNPESPTRHVDMWWHPGNKALASVVHDNTGAEVRLTPTSEDINMFDGNWHFAAITLENNTTIKIWEDGKLVKEYTSPNPLAYTNDNDLWIGCKPESNSGADVTKMVGFIDRVRIYDCALTEEQIAALYYSEMPVADIPTSVKTSENSVFRLEQNRPNPFSSETTIGYELNVPGHVVMQIYDITGTLVATPINRDMQPGAYTAKWNSSGINAGIYFYVLEVISEKGTSKKVRKMVITK